MTIKHKNGVINIKLEEDDDRVVHLYVEDKHGVKYSVGLEFLNHQFNCDEVQVNIRKGDENTRELYPEDYPTRIIHDERPVYLNNGYGPSGTWYEFHPVNPGWICFECKTANTYKDTEDMKSHIEKHKDKDGFREICLSCSNCNHKNTEAIRHFITNEERWKIEEEIGLYEY